MSHDIDGQWAQAPPDNVKDLLVLPPSSPPRGQTRGFLATASVALAFAGMCLAPAASAKPTDPVDPTDTPTATRTARSSAIFATSKCTATGKRVSVTLTNGSTLSKTFTVTSDAGEVTPSSMSVPGGASRGAVIRLAKKATVVYVSAGGAAVGSTKLEPCADDSSSSSTTPTSSTTAETSSETSRERTRTTETTAAPTSESTAAPTSSSATSTAAASPTTTPSSSSSVALPEPSKDSGGSSSKDALKAGLGIGLAVLGVALAVVEIRRH